MSSLGAPKRDQASMVRQQMAVATFAATLFSSALLMFLVQPMFAKMALPRLGGSAAVWSLALVFFQGVLLLGYGYAHVLVKNVSLTAGAAIHVLVTAIAAASLPIGISHSWDIPPDHGQALWLIGLFAVSVGLPFFAISANAPLLQAWFARSGHARSQDPYFLYGASNAGSFLALFAYPLLVEPLMGLAPQALYWSVGFLLLMGMAGACGYIASTAIPRGAMAIGADAPEAPATWRQRLSWIALSFVPSGLLVGTTAHIATDLVSAPFMWVVPLALYLLTFVITFQSRPVIPHWFVLRNLGLIIAPLCLFTLSPATQLWLVPLHLVVVFALMMGCHGELVRMRPPAGRLTEFYLLMSLGGVLGGMFASLLAPAIFTDVLEYPLLVVAGFALLGMIRGGQRTARVIVAALVVIPAGLAVVWLTGNWTESAKQNVLMLWLLVALAGLMVSRHRIAFQAVILFSVLLAYHSVSKVAPPIFQSRSFYGVLSVYPMDDGRIHMLAHGTTKHGSQVLKDENGLRLTTNPEPQSYYYANGPFGSLIRHLREGGNPLEEVAVVGLGTGAMLCHALPGEQWSFFEIDPEVVQIASNPEYFTYLRDCGPAARIYMGDGRLRLEQKEPGLYDLIVLDAFSSDSVPAHLMTVEALDIYLSKLKPDGAVVFHISNRFMELSGVVEAAARARGMQVYYNSLDLKYWKPDWKRLDMRPHLAVIGKTPEALRGLVKDPAWHRADGKDLPDAWTDDYSNVLGAIWRKFNGEKPY